MSMKSYFDKELLTSVIFAILGAVVGFASFLTNSPVLSFVIMLVVGAVSYFIVKLVAKIKQEKKWWAGNAFVVYVFVWLISWTIYYNIGLR